MEKFKLICKKIFCLPLFITVIIAMPSFAFVIIMLMKKSETNTILYSVLSYVSYLISDYALIITVTGIIRIFRVLKANNWEKIYSMKIVKKFRSNSFGEKIMDNEIFRSEVGMHGSMAMNFIYAITNGFSGIRNDSAWSITMAAYYFLLSVMRGVLVRYSHEKHSETDISAEYRRYRIIGIILLVMNQALVAMVVYMTYKNEGAVYSGLMIYWMAMYTFYITIMAIINVVRYRRLNSPVMSAAKVISLTASLVSMLSLETAMLTQFNDNTNSPDFRQKMVGISGGAVCAAVLGMAIYMIIKSTKYLRARKEEMQYEAGGIR